MVFPSALSTLTRSSLGGDLPAVSVRSAVEGPIVSLDSIRLFLLARAMRIQRGHLDVPDAVHPLELVLLDHGSDGLSEHQPAHQVDEPVTLVLSDGGVVAVFQIPLWQVGAAEQGGASSC